MALRREIKIRAQYPSLASYRLGPAQLYLDDVQVIYSSLVKAAVKRAKDSNDGEPAGCLRASLNLDLLSFS